MEIEQSYTRIWSEKVPSPTGSDDSGLGWASDSTDYPFHIESPIKMNNSFNFSETESACSPEGQDISKKLFGDFEANSKTDFDLQSFNIDQKPSLPADILDCFLEQKTDHVPSSQQQSKKASSKSNKKKHSTSDNSPSAKLERCFQPKTGNGKPRQTSVKRKPSQKCATSYPYPGVRVLTVREKLKKMRECKERPTSQTSHSAQSPSAQCQPLQQSVPVNPFQQNFNQALQQQSFQDMHPSLQHPALTSISPPANITLGNTSPLHHISQNYSSSPLTSRNYQYDLDNGEFDRVCDSYANSVSSNSPSHSSHCSSPQYPSSPTFTPELPMQHMIPPASQCSELKSSTIPYHSPINPACNFINSFDVEQANCQIATYQTKVYPQNSYGSENFSPYDFVSSPSQHHQFANQSQTHFSYDIVAQFFDCARRGDRQTLRKLLDYKPEHLNLRDQTGKSALFYAVEYGQVEVMEMLIGLNSNVKVVTAEGYNILHAAACSKTDVLVHLLKTMQLKDIHQLLNKASVKAGYTPLHLAAKKQQLNNMIQLLNCGANYLAQDFFGFSPLHIAVQNGDVMGVRALLGIAIKNQKVKEIVGQVTRSLNTPLHLAADLCKAGDDKRKHQLDIIKLLITNEADYNVFNADRCRPLDLLPSHNTSSQVLNARYLLSGTRNGGCAVDILPSMAFPYCDIYNGVDAPHSH